MTEEAKTDFHVGQNVHDFLKQTVSSRKPRNSPTLAHIGTPIKVQGFKRIADKSEELDYSSLMTAMGILQSVRADECCIQIHFEGDARWLKFDYDETHVEFYYED